MDSKPRAAVVVNRNGLARSPGAVPSGAASVEKALDLLTRITLSDEPPSFAELAIQTDLPRSTLHRLVAVLAARGLVSYDSAGRCYRPGLQLLEMARRSWESSDLRLAASMALRNLAAQVGETVHLATLVDQEVLYLEKIESPHPVGLRSAIGKRNPIYCTAVGKAMAALLPDHVRRELLSRLKFRRFTERTICDDATLESEFAAIRRNLIAFDWEEHLEGVHCVASPIFDFRGQPIGGISITAPIFRVPRRMLKDFAPLVADAAQQTTKALGGGTRARS